jgi:hypothetical protein
MKKLNLLALLAIIFLAFNVSACSDDDNDGGSYTYQWSVSSMNLKGSDSPATILQAMSNAGDLNKTFTLTGTQVKCDILAYAKFSAAMTLIDTAAKSYSASTTGTITYELTRENSDGTTTQLDTHVVTFGSSTVTPSSAPKSAE